MLNKKTRADLGGRWNSPKSTLCGQLRPPPHGKEKRSCHLGAVWPPAAPMQGMRRCECMLCLQDCSPFRKNAEPSSQLCGNLCSATALLHAQPLGRMLNLRHVRSKAGVRDVCWALGLFVRAP